MPLDPSTLSGKVLWLRAKDLTDPDNTDVATWTDQSGTTHNATSTGTAKPKIRTGQTPGGGRAVQFVAGSQSGSPDANAGYFTLPSLGLTTAGEIWVVVKDGSTAVRNSLWHLGNSSSSQFMLQSDGKRYETFGTANSSQAFTPSMTSVNTWRLYRVTNTGTVMTTYIDNVTQMYATGLTAGWSSAPLLGATKSNNSTVQYRYQGYVAEVFVRSQISTFTEANQLTDYFNTEHGTSFPQMVNLGTAAASLTPTTSANASTGTGVSLSPQAMSLTPTTSATSLTNLTPQTAGSTWNNPINISGPSGSVNISLSYDTWRVLHFTGGVTERFSLFNFLQSGDYWQYEIWQFPPATITSSSTTSGRWYVGGSSSASPAQIYAFRDAYAGNEFWVRIRGGFGNAYPSSNVTFSWNRISYVAEANYVMDKAEDMTTAVNNTPSGGTYAIHGDINPNVSGSQYWYKIEGQAGAFIEIWPQTIPAGRNYEYFDVYTGNNVLDQVYQGYGQTYYNSGTSGPTTIEKFQWTFDSTTPETLWIVSYPYYSPPATVNYTWSYTGGNPPPPYVVGNDLFANAFTLPIASVGSLSYDNTGAGDEGTNSTHDDWPRTIWYKFTAPYAGIFSINVTPSVTDDYAKSRAYIYDRVSTTTPNYWFAVTGADNHAQYLCVTGKTYYVALSFPYGNQNLWDAAGNITWTYTQTYENVTQSTQVPLNQVTPLTLPPYLGTQTYYFYVNVPTSGGLNAALGDTTSDPLPAGWSANMSVYDSNGTYLGSVPYRSSSDPNALWMYDAGPGMYYFQLNVSSWGGGDLLARWGLSNQFASTTDWYSSSHSPSIGVASWNVGQVNYLTDFWRTGADHDYIGETVNNTGHFTAVRAEVDGGANATHGSPTALIPPPVGYGGWFAEGFNGTNDYTKTLINQSTKFRNIQCYEFLYGFDPSDLPNSLDSYWQQAPALLYFTESELASKKIIWDTPSGDLEVSTQWEFYSRYSWDRHVSNPWISAVPTVMRDPYSIEIRRISSTWDAVTGGWQSQYSITAGQFITSFATPTSGSGNTGDYVYNQDPSNPYHWSIPTDLYVGQYYGYSISTDTWNQTKSIDIDTMFNEYVAANGGNPNYTGAQPFWNLIGDAEIIGGPYMVYPKQFKVGTYAENLQPIDPTGGGGYPPYDPTDIPSVWDPATNFWPDYTIDDPNTPVEEPPPPTYAYAAFDLSTNTLLAEVPFEDVNYTHRLSRAGQGSFSIPVNPTTMKQGIKDATIPGRTAIYVVRNDQIMWGGILWKRQYDASSRSVRFEAETFESYFDHRIQAQVLSFENVDQLDIARAFALQAADEMHVEVDMDTMSGVLRYLNAFYYEFKTLGSEINSLATLFNGFDYNIRIFPDPTTGVMRRKLIWGYPYLGVSPTETQFLFEYPGNIRDYTTTEDADKSGNRIFALGGGDGLDMIFAEARDNNQLNLGWLLLEQVTQYKDLYDPALLLEKSKQDLKRLHTPVTVITADVAAEGDPNLGQWFVGDHARFYITDRWNFEGVDRIMRIVGYSVQMSNKSPIEQVTLEIEAGEPF